MRPSPTRRVATAAIAVVSAGALSVGFLAAPAEAAPDPATRLAERLVRQTNINDTNRHLIALQRISDTNGGNRPRPTASAPRPRATTPAWTTSPTSSAGPASSSATPEFTYPVEVELAASLTVGGTAYRIDKMSESSTRRPAGSPDRSGVVPEDATTGCEATDFAGQDFTGTVALIRRGGCTFEQKRQRRGRRRHRGRHLQQHRRPAGQRDPRRTRARIPDRWHQPGRRHHAGRQAGAAATVDMRSRGADPDQPQRHRPDPHRPAEQRGDGRSAPRQRADGPGINDNGTGSAALLEMATAARRLAEGQQRGALRLVGRRGARGCSAPSVRGEPDVRAAARHRPVPELRHGRVAQRGLLRLRR